MPVADRVHLPLRRRPLPAAIRHQNWRGIRVQLLIEIKRTARMIDGALEALGQRAMLPERERRVLDYLHSTRNPCISDVGRHLRVSRQAAQRLVVKLQRRGFLKFGYYNDRRTVQLELTAAGSDALKLAGGKVLGLLYSITHGMDDGTLESASGVLRAQ